MATVDVQPTSRDADPSGRDLAPEDGRDSLYLDGEWAAGTGGELPVTDPTTRRQIGTVPAAARADVDRAFEAAQAD